MSKFKESIRMRLGSRFYYMPKKMAHTKWFNLNHNYRIDWKNPKTFDEKLHWLMAKRYGKKEAFYADKYAVRKYVEQCGYGNLLTDIYGTWENVKDINISLLPDKFVLKTNHASGGDYYIICKNKAEINWEKELKRIDTAMHINFAKQYGEYHYAYIKRLILAEQLLDDGKEERMIDYKIHCFNGEPYCIMVCSNRATDVKFDYYDLDWQLMDYITKGEESGVLIERPEGLETMIKAARDLSKGFPFARIDFYDVHGKVYFGEITLTPAGGNLHYLNEKGQVEFSNRLILK